MSCERTLSDLPLYFYGELTQDEEERIEEHLAACPLCTSELGKIQSLARSLSLSEADVTEDRLSECRADLNRALRVERANGAGNEANWLARLREFMNMGVGLRIPAGALALVAAGFLAGKLVPGALPFGIGGVQQAGFVNVRSVEPDSTGKVRIAFDNVFRRTVLGSMDDPKVRELLLASMRDESNPGLRVETVGVIKDHAASADIRGALLEAVQHDPNVGVRLSALEGLKLYASDPAVRRGLTDALLNDANPGVRIKVIDLLTAHKDESIVGSLQNLMRKEDNGYVRMRCTNALREMNASVGTF